MKLLVVNPFAATASRQELYARVERLTGWHITLITAARWRNDYGQLVRVSRLPQFRGELIARPVLLTGNIPLHFYAADLKRILTRVQADITHVYHEAYGTATYQVVRAHNRTARRPIGFSSQQNLNKRYPYPFRATERYVYRHTDFAIVVSEQVGKVLRRKGFEGGMAVVPNAIDTTVFKPAPPAARDASAPLRLGFLGRLVPEKGVDTLLRAFEYLDHENYTLQIAGSGPDEPRLRELAARLRLEAAVEWVGYLDRRDAAAFFHGLDVLVVPSRTTPRWAEQFGRVVIEANAAGVVVVAAASGELPRLIEATEGGWVFPEDDQLALAHRLQWIRANPTEVQKVRARGRSATIDRFDEEAVALQYARAIETFGKRFRLRTD